jgi:hypothetical protein
LKDDLLEIHDPRLRRSKPMAKYMPRPATGSRLCPHFKPSPPGASVDLPSRATTIMAAGPPNGENGGHFPDLKDARKLFVAVTLVKSKPADFSIRGSPVVRSCQRSKFKLKAPRQNTSTGSVSTSNPGCRQRSTQRQVTLMQCPITRNHFPRCCYLERNCKSGSASSSRSYRNSGRPCR